jgi:hypothetical protein
MVYVNLPEGFYTISTTISQRPSLVGSQDPTFVHPDKQNQGEREWLMKHNGGNAKAPQIQVTESGAFTLRNDINFLWHFVGKTWKNPIIYVYVYVYIYIHIYILYIYIYTGTDPQNLADATVRYPIRSNVAPNLGIRVYQVSGTAPYHDGLLITRTS